MEPQENAPNPELDYHLMYRADILIDNDTTYIESLVAIRKASGLSVLEVAKRISVAEETIVDFESYYSDPKLSLLRRYAHAVGAIVNHSVIKDPDGILVISSEIKETNDRE